MGGSPTFRRKITCVGSAGAVRGGQELVSEDAESTLVRMVTGHLGCPMTQVPTVTARFEGWEHANVHRGIEAYVAEHSPGADWHGISGNKAHMSVVDMLGPQQHYSFELLRRSWRRATA